MRHERIALRSTRERATPRAVPTPAEQASVPGHTARVPPREGHPRATKSPVANAQHGRHETHEIGMIQERIVPDPCSKEKVSRAGFFSGHSCRYREGNAPRTVEDGAGLGLDPAVGLEADREIEDAARAVGGNARDSGSVEPETIGRFVDSRRLGTVEGHLKRVRLRVGREGGAHFSGRLVAEWAERLSTVVGSGQADPGAN